MAGVTNNPYPNTFPNKDPVSRKPSHSSVRTSDSSKLFIKVGNKRAWVQRRPAVYMGLRHMRSYTLEKACYGIRRFREMAKPGRIGLR